MTELASHASQLRAFELELEAEAYAGAFAFAPTGIAVFDLDGRIHHANPALCHLLGEPPEALVGNSIIEFAAPRHRKAIQEWIATANEGIARPARAKSWFTRGDGIRRYGEVEAVFVTNADGERRYGLVMVHDRTETRNLEDTLRGNAHRFRALVKNVSDTVTIIDAEGAIEFTTADEAPALGYPRGWWDGRNVLDLAHPDDRPRAVAMLERLTADAGDELSETFRARHADGHWEVVTITARNLLDDPHINGMVLTTRNVTEQHYSEQLLAAQARILELIATSSPLDDTLSAIVEMIRESSDGARASVLLLEHGRLVPRGSRLLPRELLGEISNRSTDRGSLFTADLSVDSERIVASVATDPSVECIRPALLDAGIGSCWALPVTARAGDRPLGIIAMFHRASGEPGPHSRQAAALAAQLVAIAVERHDTETELAHRALHDDLTGLPNRTLALDRLSHGLIRVRHLNEEVAVLFLDLDRFKVVNDSLGHGSGDQLLVLFADRLRKIVRPEDTVARFGGDEFVILCEQARGALVSLAIAERVEQAMREPFVLADGSEVFLTVSMGLTVGDGPDADVLMRNADAAMYRAKELGRNRLAMFDEAIQADAVARLNLGNDLRRAVERAEFSLLHQPLVDVRSGRIVGSEALVRWNHPTRGLLKPADFIAVTEDTGLIVQIGARVLDTALAEASRWAAGAEGGHLMQSVNLSGRQLGSPALVEMVASALDRHHWPAADLCLELTESVLLDDLDLTVEALAQLKALGVRLAIDDFGTGYSSLAYLQQFPVDAVKIDRSFVTGLSTSTGDEASGAATIPRAVIVMAHALGLSVTAEGVETAEQLEVLRDLGCDVAQGYLFAAPVTCDELVALLDQRVSLGSDQVR